MTPGESEGLVLRAADDGDCDFFWEVHNEPEVRRQSLRSGAIPLEEHRTWFAQALANPAVVMWVVEEGGADRGVVRFVLDAPRRTAEISIAIRPEGRGRGLGPRAIRAGTAAILARADVQVVLAQVKVENRVSDRAFLAAGYLPEQEVEIDGVALRRYRRGATVLFRCDGGATVGWGHLIRCSAVAEALADRGIAVGFLLRDPEEAVAEHLRRSGFPLREMAAADDEVEATVAALAATGAGCLVVDSYPADAAYLDAVRQRIGVARVLLDDLADRELRCEMIVNANPGAGDLDYRSWAAPTELLGPAFAPLRRQFTPALRPTRTDPAECRVLLTLGGSQVGARVLDIAVALDRLPQPFTLDLLLGSERFGGEAVRRFAAGADHRVEVHVGVSSVVELFAATTLAVSAAGTTCFELAACGVPALLLVVADNQQRSAAAWQREGVFDLLGTLDQVEPEAVAAGVAAALEDPGWLTARSARGRQVVDGGGSGRIAEALARLLPAGPSQ